MSTRHMRRGMHMAGSVTGSVATWPPLVYLIIGLAFGAIWAFGTSAQVLTSEAWFMLVPFDGINFSAFGQLHDLLTGQLPSKMIIPCVFCWGTQFALIVASLGIEVPKDPKWRYYLAWGAVFLLIVVNSCGDFASSSEYGFWGQCGFTTVIFFVTFCVGLFSIVAFKHAWALMFSRSTP